MKLDISSTFKALHPLNIYFTLVKDEVLKYDKSSDTKDSQSENIFAIFSTFDVFKLDK